jgi:large subunit ribosomal protein L3
MPAIIGRKLGMTQIFSEDGARVTLTVIEAGPCPVTQVKTEETDGYESVQLGFGDVRPKLLNKPKLGHLRKASAPPVRHLHEFSPTEVGEGLSVGDVVTVKNFVPGEIIKVTGTSKGKGFAGTIKRHNFASGPKSHGSHNIRQPGSIGASAYPSHVFKGVRMAGHMGARKVTHPAREGPGSRCPQRHRDREARMSPLQILGAGGAASGELELAPGLAAQQIKPHLIHEVVTQELAARRGGNASTKTRSDVRGGGAKPWRQKGTGRARAGSNRSPLWVGGGVVFGPHPRSYGGKVNRKVQLQAWRSALKAHVERGTIAVMDATWDAPSSKAAAAFLDGAPEGLQARPLLVVVEALDSIAAKSFRNLRDVYVLESWELETVDVMAARSLLVERASWDRLAAIGEPRTAAEEGAE